MSMKIKIKMVVKSCKRNALTANKWRNQEKKRWTQYGWHSILYNTTLGHKRAGGDFIGGLAQGPAVTARVQSTNFGIQERGSRLKTSVVLQSII
jgi:hypothetical protein